MAKIKTSEPKTSWSILDRIKKYRPTRRDYLLVLILGLILLAVFKKSWFVAATVNGTPITNLELFSKMNDQYRQQTLNQLINEKVIFEEAKKKNIVVDNNQINDKISELEKSVGGAQVLDSLLSQQGQTRDSLKQQLKVQLIIEKLYQNEATVSAEEVNNFITQNAAALQATDSAGQIQEATNILRQQKLSELFSQKFQELRQNTNIQIF